MAEEETEYGEPSVRLYLIVYIALMLLFGLTALMSNVDLGPFNLVVALGIAAAKAILVLMIFMHLRYNHPLTWVFASAGVLWFAIMVGLTMSDYLTRNFSPYILGK